MACLSNKCLLVLLMLVWMPLGQEIVWAQDQDEYTPEEQEDVKSLTAKEKRKQRRDERRGEAAGSAVVGAIAGAALGAIVGEPGLGAAYGAAAGGVYAYDQQREDERTQMLAESIADANKQNIQPQETVGDVGKRHMQDFVGEWNVEMWVLATDGSHLVGSGSARGLSAGDNATRVVFTAVNIEAFPEVTGGGDIFLSYEPGQGFTLVSNAAYSGEVLKFAGEYLVDSNKYNFYLLGSGGDEKETGMLRSSVRVEIRTTGSAMWIAETFTYIDGKEVQVQSYRFNRG